MLAHTLTILSLLTLALSAPTTLSPRANPFFDAVKCMLPKANPGVWVCQQPNFAGGCGWHPAGTIITQTATMKFHSVGPDHGVYCNFYTEAEGKGALLNVNGVL